MKNTKQLLFFCFFLSFSISLCQEKETEQEMYDVIRSANRSYFDSDQNLNYLTPLKILTDNKNRFKDIEYSLLYDYIGFLNTAYSYIHEKDSLIQRSLKIEISENLNLADPIPFLEKEIGDNRLVMLNEAHHNSEHRLFAETLLKILKKKGFKYLAAETIYWSDTLLNHRKYPISTTGYYTRESYFSNFIRSAIKEGFTILPYEQEEGSGEINEREQNQANNIIEILNRNPSAKVFVYAGYSHIKEKSMMEGIKWMAERIKDSIHIDPFTIDQTTFTTKFIKDKPLLLNLKTAQDSVTRKFKGVYDVSILHPLKDDKIQLDLGKTEFKIKLKEDYLGNENLVLLQVYIPDEFNEFGSKAIPFEQKLLSKTTDSFSLFLNPDENYMFILKNTNNQILKRKELRTREKIISF